MTTTEQWVAEVRDHLEGNSSDDANLLASPYTAGSGTLTVTDALGNIGPGAYLSIGLNTLLVTGVNQLTKTATVIGGQRGSTDANAAANAMVRVNPRFTDFQIVREINRHLPTLSAPRTGLYQVATTTLDYDGPTEGYNLAGVTGLIRVLEVRRETYGATLAWPTVETTMWDVYRSAPSDFASGTALRVRGVDTGLTVQVVYAKTFTALAYDLTINVNTTGVSTEQEDIPPLGAAIRLMSGREVARNQRSAQGDSRRAEEVPPSAVGRSYAGLVGLWEARVAEESSRLRAQFPLAW